MSLDWPQIETLPISTSQVDRITGIENQCPASFNHFDCNYSSSSEGGFDDKHTFFVCWQSVYSFVNC
jgi:hypothetical protein